MPPQNIEQSDQYQNVPQEKKEPVWLVPASIIVCGALIGAGIYLSSKNPPRELKNTLPSAASIIMNPVTSEDHIFGNPNAEVFIVEYSDLECPFCKVFHPTMKRIMSEYGGSGKVAWVYRHFPIANLHSRAQKESEATECVAELGGNDKFWKYVDSIFNTTGSNNTLDPAELPKLAASLGIDEKKFNDCLSSGKYSAKVLSSVQDAIKAGARGTPQSILIAPNGEKVSIEGAQPYEVVKALVEAALKQ